MTVSLEESKPTTLVSLAGQGNPETQATQDHKVDLADKYSVALGPASPGHAAILAGLSSGNKNRYGSLLAQQKALESSTARNSIIQQIASQGNPTPMDLEVVRSLTMEQMESPDLNTILEQEYSKKITQLTAILQNENSGVMDDAMEADEAATMDVLDRSEHQATRNMIAYNMLNIVRNKFDTSDILIKGQAWLQTLIPFRTWTALNNFTQGAPFGAFFPGDSVEMQVAWLHSLPPDRFAATLNEGISRALSQGNFLDTLNFLEAVISYSDDDKNLENVFAGVDIATSIPVGLLTKAMKGSFRVVNTALRDAEKSAIAAGIPHDAVEVVMKQALSEKKLPTQTIRNITDVELAVPSIMRPTESFAGRTLRAGSAALTRLQRAAVARAGTAIEILTDVNRIDRIAPEQIEKGFQEAEEFVLKEFVHPNHYINNVTRNLAEDSISNVYSVTVSIGKKNGDAFGSENGAKAAAARFLNLKTDDYEIVQMDNGWVIDITRNVDESSKGIKDIKITTNGKSPENFLTKLLPSFLTGADVKLSKSQTIARGVAVMSGEHMAVLLENFARPFRALKKGEYDEFTDFLKRSSDNIDPTSGLRGVTYNTPFEFEDAFFQMFNKVPTYEQLDAWMAYKQAYDLDWLIRDADVFKQKAVLGIEKFDIKVNELPVSFEGKEVNSLPRGSASGFSVAVVDRNGKVTSLYSRYMNDDQFNAISKLKQDNHTIIQSYNGSTVIGEKRYNFIVTPSAKRGRVGMMNVNPAKGSRFLQKYHGYVKQPKVNINNGEARYFGDEAIVNTRSEKDAAFVLEKMETARKMIRDQLAKMGGKNIHLIANHRGVNRFFAENLPMFEPKQFIEAVKSGKINLNVPFKTTRSGERTVDKYQLLGDLRTEHTVNNLVDESEWSLAKNVNGRFMRDGDTPMSTWYEEKGTLYELADDNVLSPLDTLRTSMSSMVDAHVFHDYRLKSARDYTSEFGDILDGTKVDFDNNGLDFIFDPRYKPNADPIKVKQAEGVRKAIISLFNNRTIVERQVDMYKEKIVNSVRGLAGNGMADFVNDTALPMATRADVAMRAFAFHTKMGMFNVKQLFLQSTAVANVIAISPVHGITGSRLLSPLMMATHARSGLLKDLAKKLGPTAGVTAEQFEELVNIYKRSGFQHVGNDVAYLDDFMPPGLKNSAVQKGKTVLDFAATPFRVGERIARTVAFGAAYAERKAFINGRAMSRTDEAWILQRAKDMTGNMTRDSNAAYQRGYGAIITQFFGYQARLAEQMLGSKLTKGEKTRLFGMMSMLYGVPVATGMTFGVLPVREMLKDWMAEQGVEYDDTLMEPFVDGMASTILEWSTGMDLNVSERYGPGGLNTFYDLWKGDSEIRDIFLGASGGIVLDTLSDADPLWKAFQAGVDTNENTVFPLTVNDLVEPFRNISTVNNAIKLNEAVNLGRWLSANETYLTDVDLTEALTSALLGLDPERVSDAFNNLGAIETLKEHKSAEVKKLVTEYKRGIQALRSGDTENAKKFFSRAKSIGILAGLNLHEMSNAYQRAASDEPLDASVLDSYRKLVLGE